MRSEKSLEHNFQLWTWNGKLLQIISDTRHGCIMILSSIRYIKIAECYEDVR